MSVYLYHPEYFSRARRVRAQVEPIHQRLYVEQCSMDPDEWQRLYAKVNRIEAKIEKDTYMQWSSLLRRAVGVPRPEDDFRKFSFRKMRQIRDRLRKLLLDGQEAWWNYLIERDELPSRLTFQCWETTLPGPWGSLPRA